MQSTFLNEKGIFFQIGEKQINKKEGSLSKKAKVLKVQR